MLTIGFPCREYTTFERIIRISLTFNYKTTPINYCVPAGVGHQSAHILVIRIKITNKSEKKSAACQIFLGNCSSKLVIGCQANPFSGLFPLFEVFPLYMSPRLL